MTRYAEIQSLFKEWAQRTVEVLRKQLRAKKIRVSDDLFKSLATKVAQQQGLMLAADFSFLTHGRFVDMGKGRTRQVQSQANYRQVWMGQERKPKKWYSRPIYGRIHTLSAVMSSSIAEQAVRSVTENLEGK